MNISGLGGGMPRISSGASSKMQSPAQNVPNISLQQSTSQGTTPAKTLAKSLNLINSLGNENGKNGNSINIYV
ncbi:MAG: hypothetical protein HQK96_15555 [Nitrospirae bacterium]|nr:hypothetical protein [Nitrospirota bacterium]